MRVLFVVGGMPYMMCGLFHPARTRSMPCISPMKEILGSQGCIGMTTNECTFTAVVPIVPGQSLQSKELYLATNAMYVNVAQLTCGDWLFNITL